jgi:hypothetical protein
LEYIELYLFGSDLEAKAKFREAGNRGPESDHLGLIAAKVMSFLDG